MVCIEVCIGSGTVQEDPIRVLRREYDGIGAGPTALDGQQLAQTRITLVQKGSDNTAEKIIAHSCHQPDIDS
jgi:hypothetical protein